MLSRWIVRIVLGVVALFVVAIALAIWTEVTTVHTGIARTPADSEVNGLPEDATDIRWRLPHVLEPYTMYDFATSPESFQAWVASQQIDGLEGPFSGPGRIVVYDARSDSSDYREFSDAIKYSWYEEDRGIEMLYDSIGGRAYYFSHSR